MCQVGRNMSSRIQNSEKNLEFFLTGFLQFKELIYQIPHILVSILILYSHQCSQDISVGKVTRYGLAGPGSNPGGWCEILRNLPDRSWAHPATNSIFTGALSLGEVKRPERGVGHAPPPRAEAKERSSFKYKPTRCNVIQYSLITVNFIDNNERILYNFASCWL